MIEVKELHKSFDGFEALRGLNIHVPRGAVYGLVGPNGAGKSTVIRHLAGIYRQDSGEVLIGGEPVYENPAVKAKLAYIPDDIFYFGAATIRDMKNLYRAMIPTFSDERFEKLREAFPLEEKRAMRRLSKGMQKQAAFWIALSCCPEVILLPSCAVRCGACCCRTWPSAARRCWSRPTTCGSWRTCATMWASWTGAECS